MPSTELLIESLPRYSRRKYMKVVHIYTCGNTDHYKRRHFQNTSIQDRSIACREIAHDVDVEKQEVAPQLSRVVTLLK